MGIHHYGLLARRDVLLSRYIHAADLDASELKDGDWEAHVIALFGDDVYELRELVAAIERCDRGTNDCCVACGATVSDEVLVALPTRPRCTDCAITQVMTAMA